MGWNLLGFLSKKPIQSEKVLVVEDDPFQKALIQRIVESINPKLEIQWAKSRREAELLLMKESYVLILSDYLLGSQDSGMEIWNFSRKICPETPFLMVSGLSEASFQKLAERGKAGYPPFLRKPFTAEQGQTRIASILRSSR